MLTFGKPVHSSGLSEVIAMTYDVIQPSIPDGPMVIVALDVAKWDDALRIVDSLMSTGLPFSAKVGMELACAAGHGFVTELVDRYGIFIFDDQKRCDAKTTIAKTAAIQLAYGAHMADCMCHSGPDSIRAFADACNAPRKVISLGVTVLTTKTNEECQREFGRTAREQVRFYAQWAARGGLDGVVCSPWEVEVVKPLGLLTVTPGIRPSWARSDDQMRFATPAEAVERGADYLVIGRPITDPQYGPPADNLKRILDEIATVS